MPTLSYPKHLTPFFLSNKMGTKSCLVSLFNISQICPFTSTPLLLFCQALITSHQSLQPISNLCQGVII